MARYIRNLLVCATLVAFLIPQPVEAAGLGTLLRKARKAQRKGDCTTAMSHYNKALNYRRLSKRNKKRVKRLMRICAIKLASMKPVALTYGKLQTIMNRNTGKYTSCFMLEWFKNRDLHGNLLVQVVVGESGKVTSSAVVKTTLGNKRVESCVAEAIKKITFPKPANNSMGVLYPISFAKKRAN